jgi:outer membrane protein TolC
LVLLVLPLLLCPFTARAEDLTLDQALRDVDQSPRVQRARSAAEESSWKRVEATGGLLPTVSASGTHLLDKKWLLTDTSFGGSTISFPAILPTTSYTIGLNWTVFDGLANVERWQGAKAMERASAKDRDWTTFQAHREAILLFYRALAAQTLLDVASQSVKTLEEHRNDVELFKRSGLSTKYDVLRVEVQLSEARTEVLNAADNVSVSRLRLTEALGKESDERKITGELPVLAPQTIAGLEPSTGKRGDLAALEERTAGLDQFHKSSSKYWFPKIALVGQYQKYNNLNDNWLGDGFRDAYTVGVQASWTFDGLVGPTARDHQALEQKFQSEKALEMAQIKAKNDLEFWKRRYLYFCELFKARQSDIGKSAESVRLAKEGRRAGTRTNTDLLDAELELFRARAGAVNAQISSIEALVNLELASGQELHHF